MTTAMQGKTKQPLTILVDSNLYNLPEIQTLLEQGHFVKDIPLEYDLILSRKAWRYDSKYVVLAIKAARKEMKKNA